MPASGIALSSFLHFAMNLQRIGHNSCLSYRAWTRLPPVSLPHTQYRTIIRTSVAKKRKASIKEAQKDYEAKAKEQQNNQESAISELEKLRVFSAMNPQFDPWALDAPTLGRHLQSLRLPFPTHVGSHKQRCHDTIPLCTMVAGVQEEYTGSSTTMVQ